MSQSSHISQNKRSQFSAPQTRQAAASAPSDNILQDPLAPLSIAADRRRGRGSTLNPSGRYDIHKSETDDGWEMPEDRPAFLTHVILENARSIITRNDSPDIGFDQSINPYRGCEHGCVYCYARPSHAYHGLSSGLDFETHLFAKPNAGALLEKQLSESSYRVKPLAIGTNTDPYQPIERRYRLMRDILEVLGRTRHPVGIVTKSALISRDIDLLAPMAEKGLVKVALSITTLNNKLARTMEPRAASPKLRLETIRRLSEAGIRVAVMVAPIIPGMTDHEIEDILHAARDAGATEAGYVLLRLPHEVKALMHDWLKTHYPDMENRVFSLIRDTRNGHEYDANWGIRQVGTGPYAWMIGRRFQMAVEKLNLKKRSYPLRTDLFTPPLGTRPHNQLNLFA